MENRPSANPRDMALLAGMRDAATLGNLVASEFQATYDGPERATYLAELADWLSDLGGIVEDGPLGASATLDGRHIAIRFGPVSGHR